MIGWRGGWVEQDMTLFLGDSPEAKRDTQAPLVTELLSVQRVSSWSLCWQRRMRSLPSDETHNAIIKQKLIILEDMIGARIDDQGVHNSKMLNIWARDEGACSTNGTLLPEKAKIAQEVLGTDSTLRPRGNRYPAEWEATTVETTRAERTYVGQRSEVDPHLEWRTTTALVHPVQEGAYVIIAHAATAEGNRQGTALMEHVKGVGKVQPRGLSKKQKRAWPAGDGPPAVVGQPPV
ncbi:hypothetical protein BJV74DRAFT_990169 [Russula compacta]|nr:hypothetical protein BJV74DRAFT_990169 [Russula compacta]